MNSNLPSPALSLQQKLDLIALERDVLALRRELAEGGLREGDAVRALDGGALGRLLIARDESPPRLRVVGDDGSVSDFSSARWRRA
jgi:hypothetical protein